MFLFVVLKLLVTLLNTSVPIITMTRPNLRVEMLFPVLRGGSVSTARQTIAKLQSYWWGSGKIIVILWWMVNQMYLAYGV